MVMANIPDSHGTPSEFRVFKLIEVMHNGEPCVAFNQTTIGDQTLRAGPGHSTACPAQELPMVQ